MIGCAKHIFGGQKGVAKCARSIGRATTIDTHDDKTCIGKDLRFLGYTHRMLGDYPGSLDFYQKALAIDPDHKGAHEYLGELYLMMHDSGSANTQLAELTRLCPDGCDEKDALTKAMADYHASAQAAAAQASTPASVPTAAKQP